MKKSGKILIVVFSVIAVLAAFSAVIYTGA